MAGSLPLRVRCGPPALRTRLSRTSASVCRRGLAPRGAATSDQHSSGVFSPARPNARSGVQSPAGVQMTGRSQVLRNGAMARFSTSGRDARIAPRDGPRALHRFAVMRHLQALRIGETGFEPATARPPARPIPFCEAPFGGVERRGALSCAQLRSLCTPDCTPVALADDELGSVAASERCTLRVGRAGVSTCAPARRRGAGLTSPLPDLPPLALDTDPKGCCARLYESEAVRWLLDGELHPGGDRLTRRLAQLAGVERGLACST